MSPFRLFWVFLGLFLLAYFGLSTISPEIRKSSETRKKDLEITGVENLIREQMGRLTEGQKAELRVLEENLQHANEDSMKIQSLGALSAYWLRLEEFAIAGAYARKLAELEKNADRWSLSGQAFLRCLEGNGSLKEKQFCRQNALHCFDQALSLQPMDPMLEMYKALTYVKMPDEEPMKGVRMLLELEKKHPELVALQWQLADLAMQTGQLEKAEARLRKLLELEPGHETANCLMVQLLNQMNRNKETEKYIIHCKH